MTTIPNEYKNIVEGYLGEEYSDKVVGFGTQKDVLWATFLAQNNLSATDPLVVAQDPTILAKFMTFVQATYDGMQVNALSPDEINRRALMFSVYDLVVLMLTALQNNIGVVGENVAFLNRYKREYAEMMGREASAFYIGGSSSLAKPNINNLDDWTLGYGKLSMDDYLTKALSDNLKGINGSNIIKSVNIAYQPPAPNVQQQGGGGPAVIIDALSAIPTAVLVALGPVTTTGYNNFQPQAQNTLSFNTTSAGITFTYSYQQQYRVNIQPYTFDSHGVRQNAAVQTQTGFYTITNTSPPVTFTPGMTEQQKLEAVQAAYRTFLNTQIVASLPTVFPSGGPYAGWDVYSVIPMPNYPPFPDGGIHTIYDSMTQPVTIYNVSNWETAPNATVIRSMTHAWDPQYNGVFTSTSDERQNAFESGYSRKRGQINSLLQQYITNTQSKIQIISNQADAQTSQETQAQTGFNQAASLLTTMIGQLSTILTSIFQGAS
ncbi:MAG: hypothetical protein LLF94_06695 [Chlamydiales bacterium]|nr:hypothetical protein [Chlamydiales bacterium]